MSVVNGNTQFMQRGVYRSTWTLGIADTGSPVQLARYQHGSVQFGGTFGGATVVLEASDDGVTYTTMTGESPTGGADVLISATSAQRFDFVATPYYIRPRTSGGTGSAVVVTLTSKGSS